MKFNFYKWSLPILILTVAGFQFHEVYTNQLTRWKGGGFGMYSEIHPLDKRVWVITPDSSWIIHDRKTTLGQMAHTLRFFPNNKAMDLFGKKVATTYKLEYFNIEVWEPFLNPENNKLSKKLTARAKFPK